jgi:hypothetical protein
MICKVEKINVYKIQGWESVHQKYKANESTSRHIPKKKQKQTINTNKVKSYANMINGYELMINDNKEDLR